MQVAVIGAGVVGALTAERLLAKGCTVTVIEAAAGPAQGASGANGAQLSYSFADPMAAPELLPKLPGLLLGRDPGMRIRLRADWTFLQWGLAFLRNCTRTRARDNATALLTLAARSAVLMDRYAAEFGADYLARTPGKLVVFNRAPTGQDHQRVAAKSRAGCEARIVLADEAMDIEPALRRWPQTPGFAVYSPNDAVGDAERFTCTLLARLAKQGVRLHFSQRVEAVKPLDRNQLELCAEQSLGAFDAVVVCTGVYPGRLLDPLGLRLPIYPVTGYSLTLPAKDDSAQVSITAMAQKLVFSRLGDAVRIAGFADINPSPSDCRARQQQLLSMAKQLAPDAADFGAADPKAWTGQRPMTPSGVPIIGATPVPGLYLNLGHGMLGWTLAAGSGQAVADAIVENRGAPRAVSIPAGLAS